MSRATSVRTALSALVLPLLLAACAGGGAAGPHGVRPATPAPGPAAPPPDASTPVEEGVDFVVYGAEGDRSSLTELLDAAAESEALLIGEEHNDAIGHRVQYRILTEGHRRLSGAPPNVHPSREAGTRPPAPAGGRPVVLSLEMFERDVQYIVDEYLDGEITESHFRSSSRPWSNYEADYRPMVEYARVHGIEVVAANAPRRYVNRVSRLGPASLDDLSEEARRFLPPLPYPGPSDAYRAEWDALMGGASGHMPGGALDAQSLWDAAMAHAVAGALDRTPDALVVHLAGGFHVENGTGTPEALASYRPGTRAVIVAIRPVDDPTRFDSARAGAGDFVILTRAPSANASGGGGPP